jgi:CRISPR/Cas system Type II protein with McrA/HNH and RuvC-like nuclease domain
MAKILGLDLGTNSIGWAVVEMYINNEPCLLNNWRGFDFQTKLTFSNNLL